MPQYTIRIKFGRLPIVCSKKANSNTVRFEQFLTSTKAYYSNCHVSFLRCILYVYSSCTKWLTMVVVVYSSHLITSYVESRILYTFAFWGGFLIIVLPTLHIRRSPSTYCIALTSVLLQKRSKYSSKN